ncbi:hypothetical protein D3C80_739860 [compost metagenome]
MRIRAAAQDDRIAGLEAKCAGIRRYIRAAFVNDADNTKRRAYALDLQPVRTIPGGDDLADRIGQRRNRADTFGDTSDPRIVEREPVHEGSGKTGGFRRRQILAVGSEDRFLRRLDGGCHGEKRAVLLVRAGDGQRSRSSFCLSADGHHQRVDIMALLHGLFRHGSHPSLHV